MASRSKRDRRGRRPRGASASRRAGRAGARGTGAGALFQSKATLAVVVGAVVGLLALGIFFSTRGVSEAADFPFTLYQGEDRLGAHNLTFADVLDDGKPVVLNFWGGSCPPCRFEMPDLQRVYERHQDDVIFLGIDTGQFIGLGTRQSAMSLLSELRITYPAGWPPDRGPMLDYGVTGLPATVFIDTAGEIVRHWPGVISEAQANDIISGMLGER